MARYLAAALVIAGSWLVSSSHAEAPKLSYVVPAAGAAGQSVDVTCVGSNLAKLREAWSNLGLKFEIADPAKPVIRLNIPKDAAPGIYGLRIAAEAGVSNLALFMVDELPTLQENHKNKSLESAQELQLPVAVEGTGETESYDFFKFRAEAGQRISVEVVARRLGSPLDPVIRLIDSAGNELAYSDDEEPIGPDSRFVHRFAKGGEYFLELRDIRYQGGTNYRYRLRIGDFPLATAPFPLAAQKGSLAKIAVTGRSLGSLAPLEVKLPADMTGDSLPITARYGDGKGSIGLTLLATNQPEQVEFEPNNTRETASPIEPVGAINGQFAATHDRDYYRFEAKKGQHLVLVGRTRSLGSPSDLFMRLFDAKGAKVAEADDSGSDEGVLDYTFPADGTYQLMVEDLLNRGGPDFVYRVEFQTFKPGFSLVTDAEKYDAPRGGVFVAKLTATRRGYAGPIELALEGVQGDFKLSGNTIPASKTTATLTVTVPENLAPGSWQAMRIVGRAKIDNADFTATASSLVALRTALNGATSLPADLDGALAVGVGPPVADFFKLAVEPKVVSFPQLIGGAAFQVKLTRLEKFADAVALSVTGLPTSFTVKSASIDKGKTEATVEVSGPRALAEGDYPIRVVGRGTYLNQPREVVAEAVLRVTRPVQVTITPAGKLAPGGKQKIKINVVRLGGEKGEIGLRCLSLPRGVQGPETATIAADKNETEVELSANASAQPGSAELVLTATTKIKDQEVTFASDPAKLEIAAP